MKNNKIIGREAEQAVLGDLFNSKKAEFPAVYGRRRIGKTYLIENYFSSKRCLYFGMTGLKNGSLKEQLTIFSKKMSETFFADIGMQMETATDWMHAFQLLTNAINKFAIQKKAVIFFDELPWLAAKKSGFKNALDYFWNTVWSKDSRIILIVCGSAASWMIKNIINDKGGLHNRITSQLPLYPFSLKETQDYLHYIGVKSNHQQTLEFYIALGGVPHYLQKIKPGLSAAQNISLLCFEKNGQLVDEFDKLFASLFDKSKAYVELIKIMAAKRGGISRIEIEKKAKLSKTGGTLTERLTALGQAGFIKSFIPIGYIEKGIYYKLIDEFCYFYLTWIDPIKKQIANEVESTYWISKINTPAWYAWSGYAFEAVCLKHIKQIKNALFIPSGALSGSWQNEGAQIDLLFDREDGVVTLCEIKYSKSTFEIDKKYALELQRKVSVFRDKSKCQKQIYIAMIASNGIKHNQYAEELVTGRATLDDLFK